MDEALSWLPQLAAVQKTAPPGQPKVLLADDNGDLREYARRLLAEHYDVEAVGDGEVALAAARARKPDLVVSDVMMPKLDGFGLIRELRADTALRDVPVLLLSARAGEEARIEGHAKGADAYLVKPFSARELLVRVAALLQSAEVRRQALEQERAAAEAIREKEALLAALVEHVPVGIGVTDIGGRFILRNDAMSRFVGPIIPSLDDERHGRWHGYRADGRRIERHDYPARRALRGEVDPGTEYLHRNDDGTECWIRVAAVPLRDAAGGVSGAVVLLQDIDAAKRAHEELRESDRRKDEFLATLSHELRNPLAPLRNALALLKMSGNGDAGFTGIREMMERQVSHLVRLVDDLLEISRISRGMFELRKERVAVEAIVTSAMETSGPVVKSRRHEVRVSLPEKSLWVDGDPVRLAQILANLINNAAKYTAPGGRIALEVARRSGAVEIAVADNGQGIAPELLPRVFEMFVRGEHVGDSGQGGLGIGLAIARRLAEMHGGSIEAASSGPGQGSRFTVRLPLSAAREGERVVQPERADAAVLLPRVLVVDDNSDSAESLGMVLRFLGADVYIACDGPQALEAFRRYEPAVVLLDIGMPGMDGYEVARRLRECQPGRRAAIVALTGWGQADDRRRSREAGFDHHIVKPADIGALRELLASLERSPSQ